MLKVKDSKEWVINSKEDYNEFIKLDKLANGFVSRSFALRIVRLFFPNPIEIFLKRLRKYEYIINTQKDSNRIVNSLRLFIIKIKFRKISVKLGFSIPINTFGAGLSIPHYGTIIVSKNAKIGRNCRLHAGVNIGASAGNKDAPTIGDNVYIGPGAILFGDIEIADNVTIGANATINRNCTEKNCVLAGTPGQIVKKGYPVWWQNNGLELETIVRSGKNI